MVRNLGDADAGLKDMQKAIRRIHPNAGAGDGSHAGSGAYSVLIAGVGSLYDDASGDYAVAVGTDAIASAAQTSAFGFGAEATAIQGTALGTAALATGEKSTAAGRDSRASADYASALGSATRASDQYASAIGTESTAEASGASALGAYSHVYSGHTGSTAVGAGAETTAADQLMLGMDHQTVVAPGYFRVASNPPPSSSAAGVAGQFTWASGFLYICVSANSWRRVALSTF